MESFIETRMAKVIKDFRASVKENGRLCHLKTLTYEGGKTPDYSQAFVQQYYMLRFFPAYLFEYFTIYRKIIAQKLVTPPLNVLSIGCGCGVDYYGLDQAIRRHPKYATDLKYTGIDLVRWKYRDALGRDDVFFLKNDIAKWDELDEADYNIIMFPKSIGEFPPNVFTHIKKMLKNSTFDRDQLCLACSLMDIGKETDISRFTQLVRIMTEEHGYTASDDPNGFWEFPKTEKPGIKSRQPDWTFPNDILDFMKELSEHCPIYIANGESCRTDCSVLNRKPILTTNYIKFQTLGLHR